MIRDYDFHPPDDVRLFEIPAEGVRRLDDEMFVAEVRHSDSALRHYAFRDHWFKIRCTTDLSGTLVETTSDRFDIPFTFKCDIATPMLRSNDTVYAVDLWLDVVIRGDGQAHRVYDEDDFAEAQRQGWLSQHEVDGARAGLAELLSMIARGTLLDFVSEAHPFAPTDPPEAASTKHLDPSEIPILQPHRRPSW